MENKEVRIVSINTWKCDGDYDARIQLLTQELVSLKLDAVVLQEAFYLPDDTVNTAKFVANKLGMKSYVVPAREKKRIFQNKPQHSYSGLAVCTREHVSNMDIIRLPHDIQDGERIAQVLSIDIFNRQVLIVNIHLTHLKGATQLRLLQLQAIIDYLNEKSNFDMCLLCGDFNATLESDELKWLLNNDHFSVMDTYSLAGGKEPRNSFHQAAQENDNRCIDYIYSYAENRYKQPEFTYAAMECNKEVGGLFPSDHQGVFLIAQL